MIEPKPTGRGVQDALARARTLIEQQNFSSAAHLYEQLLDDELEPVLRSEVQTNLAAALCTLAQSKPVSDNTIVDQLDRARDLLMAALQQRQQGQAPREWAASRANLALVYMARHRATRNENDILSAHMALDGTEDALRRAEAPDLLEWVRAIRDHLLELRERRARRRQT
jgi:hypothetical protein